MNFCNGAKVLGFNSIVVTQLFGCFVLFTLTFFIIFFYKK